MRRWETAIAPILDALNCVAEATILQQPSTAYQRAFQAGLAPRIQKALAAFQQAAKKGFSAAAEAQAILEQITRAVEQRCRSGRLPPCTFVSRPHSAMASAAGILAILG